MKSLEFDFLLLKENQYAFRYWPVKLHHPITGFSYGIEGEWTDKSGRKRGRLLLMDVSCDYVFVSRVAGKCTAQQLNPDQLLEVIERVSV